MTYHQILKEIDLLREQGYKIKISHLRTPPKIDIPDVMRTIFLHEHPHYADVFEGALMSTRSLRALGLKPEHKRGTTIVTIVDPHGNEYVGEALVSKKDRFNKKIGLQAAYGRAKVQAEMAEGRIFSFVH